MIFVLNNEFCTFNEIVDHIGKAPSTISWHIKRLREVDVLGVNQGNDHTLYSVRDRTRVDKVLFRYKETFTERVIDNYTEIVDKL